MTDRLVNVVKKVTDEIRMVRIPQRAASAVNIMKKSVQVQSPHRTRFRPYPAYKYSGVEWLGIIPAHWEMSPLFVLAREQQVRNIGTRENNVLSLSYGRIVRRDISDNFGLMPESFNTYQIVEPGNIVLRLTDLQNDKRSLRVGLVNEHGIITSAYLALGMRGTLVPEYAAFLLHAYDVTKVFYSLGGGVRQTMKFNDLKWMPLLVPNVSEQRAIAAFLDRETARIDALISKNQRLIELLQEQRTALVARAVTKGLDPNVPMKHSGVEWLGEIPAHWKVIVLKRLFANLDHARVPLSGEERATMAKEYPYYGASGIIDQVEDYLFDEPLILVAEDGANLFTRSTPLAFVVTGKYWVNNHAHILRPKDGDVEYWAHMLATIVFDPWISGSAQPKLTSEKLGSIPIPVPPASERTAMLPKINGAARQIDQLIAKVRAGIDCLKELRASLISAAVTGKIDVRGEVT